MWRVAAAGLLIGLCVGCNANSDAESGAASSPPATTESIPTPSPSTESTSSTSGAETSASTVPTSTEFPKATLEAAVAQDGTVTVTNVGSSACSVSSVDDGVLRLSSVAVDGVVSEPQLGRLVYEDGLLPHREQSETTLEAGASVVLIRAASLPPTGRWLAGSTVDTGNSGLYSLYDTNRPGAYEVQGEIEIPPSSPSVDDCVLPATPVVLRFAVNAPNTPFPTPYVLVPPGVVSVLLLLRNIPRRRVRQAVVGVLVGTVSLATLPTTSGATLKVHPLSTPDVIAAFNDCVSKFTAAGDPGLVLARAMGAKNSIQIIDVVQRWTSTVVDKNAIPPEASNGVGLPLVQIEWNSKGLINGKPRKLTDGTPSDPCTSLYHELTHAADYVTGTYDYTMCGKTKIETAEVTATIAENAFRAKAGLPVRKTYGGHALPASAAECKGKKPASSRSPREEDDPCGWLDSEELEAFVGVAVDSEIAPFGEGSDQLSCIYRSRTLSDVLFDVGLLGTQLEIGVPPSEMVGPGPIGPTRFLVLTVTVIDGADVEEFGSAKQAVDGETVLGIGDAAFQYSVEESGQAASWIFARSGSSILLISAAGDSATFLSPLARDIASIVVERI